MKKTLIIIALAILSFAGKTVAQEITIGNRIFTEVPDSLTNFYESLLGTDTVQKFKGKSMKTGQRYMTKFSRSSTHLAENVCYSDSLNVVNYKLLPDEKTRKPYQATNVYLIKGKWYGREGTARIDYPYVQKVLRTARNISTFQ